MLTLVHMKDTEKYKKENYCPYSTTQRKITVKLGCSFLRFSCAHSHTSTVIGC